MMMCIQLKICEGCGLLWYRASEGASVYCSKCEVKLGRLPAPRTRRRPGGRRKSEAKAAPRRAGLTGGCR